MGWATGVLNTAVDWGGAALNTVGDLGMAGIDLAGDAYNWAAPAYLGGTGGFLDTTIGTAAEIAAASGGIDPNAVADLVTGAGGVEELTGSFLAEMAEQGLTTTDVILEAGNRGMDISFWQGVTDAVTGVDLGRFGDAAGDAEGGGFGDLLSDIGSSLGQAGEAYGRYGGGAPTGTSIAPGSFPQYRAGPINLITNPGIAHARRLGEQAAQLAAQQSLRPARY